MIRCRRKRCAVYSHKTGKRLTKPGSKAKAVKDLRRIKYYSKVK